MNAISVTRESLLRTVRAERELVYEKPVLVLPSSLVEFGRELYGDSVTIIEQDCISAYDRHVMNRKPRPGG